MFDLNELLRRVEAYLEESGETASAFGKRVNGDPNLVADLRDGRDIRASTAHKIIAATESTPRKQRERARA